MRDDQAGRYAQHHVLQVVGDVPDHGEALHRDLEGQLLLVPLQLIEDILNRNVGKILTWLPVF